MEITPLKKSRGKYMCGRTIKKTTISDTRTKILSVLDLLVVLITHLASTKH